MNCIWKYCQINRVVGDSYKLSTKQTKGEQEICKELEEKGRELRDEGRGKNTLAKEMSGSVARK